MTAMKLFTYWRSQAAFRVRIALRLKGLAMEKVTLDLLAGDQFAADYQKLNPEGVVPTLIDGDGEPLVQSLAILEYLDEKYPDPPLLPQDLHARAHARAIAQMVAMDAHPFIVPRVRKYLEEELRLDEGGAREMGAALARRRQPRRRGGAGEGPAHRTILRRRSGDGRGHLSRRAPDQREAVRRARSGDYPAAGRIYANCMAIEAFASEHPLRQPDAPKRTLERRPVCKQSSLRRDQQ